jgi:nucleotide-binding universal stress UspA family protein
MYRSLLIPLDGSSFAEQALPMAVEIAVRSGAALHIVLVHKAIAVVPGPGEPVVLDPVVDDASRRQEEEYLATVSKPLTGKRLHVVTSLLDGPTAQAIGDYARARAIDLVVLTTHGRGILSRFWIGSVADRLVRQLEQPILLVRPQAVRGAPSPATVRRILVPLDGSPLAASMVEPAVRFGELLGAEFTLFRAVVLPPPVWLPVPGVIMPPEGGGSASTRLELEAKRYLHHVAQQLRLKGLSVEAAVEVAPDPVSAIADYAERHGADLIAIATHGYGGATRLLLGSVADKLLRTATVPLLVWRPRAEQSWDAVSSMETAFVTVS